MIRVKICGITKPEQGQAIAQLGATDLGFICVPESPRYIAPEQIRRVVDQLPTDSIAGQPLGRIGVFVNTPVKEICQVVATAGLNGVQLHGSEAPHVCDQLKLALSGIEIIKAVRVQTPNALRQADFYQGWVDALLLDAYHPEQLGGTGKTLDWPQLQRFRPDCSWFLAGGLTPDNILEALSQVQPNGIDLSSGVEHCPGDKDLDKVANLLEKLRSLSTF